MSLYDVDDLTKNNNRPSDNTIFMVKGLLSIPLKQLEDINLKIKGLEAKRVEIEESIKGYRRILAPMRRVPQDVLRIIFEYCLTTHRNPTMAATEAPVLLTRVCSSWRAVAMTSPRLWAQLHIPFRKEVEEDNSRRKGGDPLIPLQLITTVLRHRCHAVYEWLSRSGDLPLSISVDYKQPISIHITTVLGTDQIDNPAMSLLNTILGFSSRWKTLELNVPVSIYQKLESMLSARAHTLPFLLQLRAAIYQDAYSSNSGDISSPSTTLLRARNLKIVSLSCPRISDLLRPTNNVPVAQLTPWNSGITHVSLSVCSLDDCIILLKGHPQLIRCNLFTGFNNWEADQQTIIHELNIYLPHLLSLGISTSAGASRANFAATLYNAIHAPRLRWVGFYINRVLYEGDSAATDRISLSFFHRATNLTKLEIDRFFLLPSNILDVFEAQHTLTHLALTCKFGIWPRVLSAETDPFNLETLVAQVDADDEYISTSSQLLPHLEVFELHRTIVSDDLVLRFVSSRMNPKLHIAVLKKVKIHFDRLKEPDVLDLAEKIRVRADMARIQINTSFQYALSTLQVKRVRNFLSPSYIPSNGANDCTWKHEDILDESEDYDSYR